MKLKLTIALCLLALVMMTGCSDDKNSTGHDSGLVGTWDLTSATMNGSPVDNQPVWRITLAADGTGVSTMNGVASTATWSTSGDQLTLTVSGGGELVSETATYNVESNTLTLTDAGDMVTLVLTFARYVP